MSEPPEPTVVGVLDSVNTGQPADLPWRGRLVRTAIDKWPVNGRVAVSRLNVAGDGQADLVGHGGEHRAVFVYQRESYRYWREQLGRDLPRPGTFGENFTVTGLGDSETRIGDRLRIGTAEFEVTQPRVTCFKVGIALREPRMPSLLTGHGRPGFYLRVLREGAVGAGDVITLVARVAGALTVRQTSDLLYGSQHERDLLRRSIDSPALSDGWRESFRALHAAAGELGNAGLGAAPPPPAWEGFRPFHVSSVVVESPTVRSLHLRPVDGVALPPHRPGQFVTVRLGGPEDPWIRSYTISAASDPRRLRVTVRRAGPGSTQLHRLGVGATVEVAAPRGTFTLSDDPAAPVLLASAGVGVTPAVAMLADLAEHPSGRQVTWLQVARSAAEHLFATDVAALLARVRHARSRVFYTAPGDEASGPFVPRRPTAADVEALDLTPDTHAFVCGPAGFMADLSVALIAAGLPPDHVNTETFGAATPTGHPPHPPAHQPAVGVSVTFARSGLTVLWAPEQGTVLDLAEACDVPVSWSCRSGVCHRCQVALVSGTVAYDPTPLDPPPPGTVLVCSATPRGAVTLDL